MEKTAIVLGATGLTGGYLLDLLLEDQRYTTVFVFGRRSVNKTHPKLKEIIVDLLDLEQYKANFKADIVFCCIGTTKAKTPDKERYRKIDYGIPVTAAKLCKINGITKFIVMSSMGADKTSKVFYSRTKGEMEADVLALHINQTYILQPSLISGNREELRLGEYLVKLAMTIMNPILVGRLKNYRSIHPKAIAKTMAHLGLSLQPSGLFKSNQIKELASLWP